MSNSKNCIHLHACQKWSNLNYTPSQNAIVQGPYMCEMQHIYNYKRTKLWYSKSVLSTVHDSQRPWFFHQSGDRDFGFLLIQINNYHKFNTLVFFLHFGRHSWSFIVVASRDSVERNVEEIVISGSWMASFTCERHEDPPKEWKSQASSYVVYYIRITLSSSLSYSLGKFLIHSVTCYTQTS